MIWDITMLTVYSSPLSFLVPNIFFSSSQFTGTSMSSSTNNVFGPTTFNHDIMHPVRCDGVYHSVMMLLLRVSAFWKPYSFLRWNRSME